MRAERLIRRHQLAGKLALAFLQIRIVELPRQHLLDVSFADQAETQGRFAKTDAEFFLHAQHAFGIFRGDFARGQQQGADAGVAAPQG